MVSCPHDHDPPSDASIVPTVTVQCRHKDPSWAATSIAVHHHCHQMPTRYRIRSNAARKSFERLNGKWSERVWQGSERNAPAEGSLLDLSMAGHRIAYFQDNLSTRTTYHLAFIPFFISSCSQVITILCFHRFLHEICWTNNLTNCIHTVMVSQPHHKPGCHIYIFCTPQLCSFFVWVWALLFFAVTV